MNDNINTTWGDKKHHTRLCHGEEFQVSLHIEDIMVYNLDIQKKSY